MQAWTLCPVCWAFLYAHLCTAWFCCLYLCRWWCSPNFTSWILPCKISLGMLLVAYCNNPKCLSVSLNDHSWEGNNGSGIWFFWMQGMMMLVSSQTIDFDTLASKLQIVLISCVVWGSYGRSSFLGGAHIFTWIVAFSFHCKYGSISASELLYCCSQIRCHSSYEFLAALKVLPRVLSRLEVEGLVCCFHSVHQCGVFCCTLNIVGNWSAGLVDLCSLCNYI